MAKSRKQKGYTDPLGSIFDFIFTNAKQKPVKTKPRKTTAKDPSQLLVRGLAEIAARPANYVSEAALGPLKEIGGSVTLVDFQTDQFDGDLRRGKDPKAGRMRIRAGDVGKFMSDPNKFVDSILENAKNERKMGGYLNMGRGLDTALLALWAAKQGASAGDAAKLGFAASNVIGSDQMLEARNKLIQNVVVGYIQSDNKKFDLKTSQETLKTLEKFRGTRFNSVDELERELKKVPSLAGRSDFKEVVNSIYGKYEDIEKGKLKDGVRLGSPWEHPHDSEDKARGKYYTEGVLNRYGYISTLSDNLLVKARTLDPNDPKQRDQQVKLMQTRQALQTVLRLKGPAFSTRNMDNFANEYAKGLFGKLNNEIKTKSISSDPNDKVYAQELRRLMKRMNDEITEGQNKLNSKRLSPFNIVSALKRNSYSDFRKVLETDIDIEIKQTEYLKLKAELGGNDSDAKYYNNLITTLVDRKKGLLTAPGFDWRLGVADTVSIYRSITGTITGPGLAAGIATGTFFFADDFVSPGNMDQHYLARYEPDKKFGKAFKPVFVKPKDDIAPHYAALSNLYYFTPGSIAKTFFWNGEAFAALTLASRERNVRKYITDANFQAIQRVLADAGLNPPSDIEGLITNLPMYHHLLSPHKDKLGGVWNTFNKVFDQDQKGVWGTALRVFSAPSRAFGIANEWYTKQIKNKVGAFLNKNLYSKVFPKLGAKLASGMSLKPALRALIQEALVAIGATTGPIGIIASTIITLASDAIIEKLMKPIMKIFFAFVWFIMLFLFFFVGMLIMGVYNISNPKPFQHIVPTEVDLCVEENPFEGLYKTDPVIAGGNYGNAPANSTCPIQSPTMNCTQGDGAGSSTYHQTRHGLDIGLTGLTNSVWYAPTKGTVTSFTAVNLCGGTTDYGGSLTFVDSSGNEYIILHVKQLASGAVDKGKPVAIIQTGLQTSGCWTGAHFHLEVKSKGSFVDDTESWYRNVLKCNINTGFACHGQ